MQATNLISRILVGALDKLEKGDITMEQVNFLIGTFEEHKFASDHGKFFPAIRLLAGKVKAAIDAGPNDKIKEMRKDYVDAKKEG